MRTTVTLESDVEALVRRRMVERGTSFKQALNDLIREGVRGASGETPTFTTESVSLGVPSVNLDGALRVAADIEDEETLRKMRLGK